MWVRNNKGNVFVGNLPPDFPDERLAEVFDPFGIVLSAVVARDPSTGARLRYGFVDIATEKAAAQAISALDGSEVDGSKLNVKARERRAPAQKSAGPPRRQPFRAAAPSHAAPSHAPPSHATPSHPTPNRPAADFSENPGPRRLMPMPLDTPRPSQSQMAREGTPEIEPPPRHDFEVVRRPLRRKEPSFQVERRPLPRRV
jgi:RNA recognition motif-containing protein